MSKKVKFYIRNFNSPGSGGFVEVSSSSVYARFEDSNSYFRVDIEGNDLSVRHSEKVLSIVPVVSNVITVSAK